jgi:hypothetical protein
MDIHDIKLLKLGRFSKLNTFLLSAPSLIKYLSSFYLVVVSEDFDFFERISVSEVIYAFKF